MNIVFKIGFAVLLFFSTSALWGYNFAALERVEDVDPDHALVEMVKKMAESSLQ
jgi:hypothetical protein